MLMNIHCSTVTSIAVCLEFDNKSKKDVLIGCGDLISVDFNHNGRRTHFEGKVISINAKGTDPKGWSIILDGSGCFDSDQVRFSPMNIIDIHVLRKADRTKYIETTDDLTKIVGLRVVKDRIQYSKDGVSWRNIKIDSSNIIQSPVRDDDDIVEEGPECDSDNFTDEDIIEEESY